MLGCDRFWLLTWTTYGSWLPGDERGFVSRVKEGDGPRVEHDAFLTPYDIDMPRLKHAARSRLKSPPIFLIASQAEALVTQFRETAEHRHWCLLAAAVMVCHAHLFVGVPGDPDPETLLRDFKSYGSRALNSRWPKPASGTWWTESGSKRKKSGLPTITSAIAYVRDQPNPLTTWLADDARELVGERGASALRDHALENRRTNSGG